MAHVTDVFEQETFRPAFTRTLAGAVMAICAIAALSVIGAGVDAVVTVWPWLALVGYVSWAVFWRPLVSVDAAGVHVVNVFRTYDVPWPAIEAIDTKWALTLVTRLGTVRAWSAPAPGRHVQRRARPADRRIGGVRGGEFARPSDLPHTESGAAALIVRQRWLRIRERGYLDDARVEFERMPARWHVSVIAGLVLFVATTIASLSLA